MIDISSIVEVGLLEAFRFIPYRVRHVNLNRDKRLIPSQFAALTYVYAVEDF